MPNCVTAARQTLTLFVGVQILVGQPQSTYENRCSFFVFRRLRLHRGRWRAVLAPMPCTAPTERTSWLPLQARGAKSRTQYTSVRPIYQNVPPRAALLNISPRGRNISHARSAYFTAPKARFHTAAKLPYFTAKPPRAQKHEGASLILPLL